MVTPVMANTRFSDIVLDDPALSMAAKGVFVSVGFLGNGCSLEDLAKHTLDGLERVEAAVNELVQAGYVSIEDERLHIRAAPKFGILG
jgi:hypothetical protein